VTDRPILFSAPMVRAILAGTKTQTRRLVKPLTADRLTHCPGFLESLEGVPLSQYGQPGDRLWMRETWRYADWTEEGEPHIEYAADGTRTLIEDFPEEWAGRLMDTWVALSDPINFDIDQRAADRRWRPSIHMPRWASRITLNITDVRVERLHGISQADAMAEGIAPEGDEWRDYMMPSTQICLTPRGSFETLWSSINGAESWEANPWVWVVEFERASLSDAAIKEASQP
jgi:hypothetical protein